MSNVAVAKQWFEASAANDPNAYADLFTDDAVQKIDNDPPVVGREAIHKLAADLAPMFADVSYTTKAVWDTGDAVICQNDVTFRLHDGQTFTFPRLNIFRLEGGKIRHLQTYGDVSPAFAAAYAAWSSASK